MKVVAHCGLTRSAGGVFYAVSSLARGLISEQVDLSVFGRKDGYMSADLPAWGATKTFSYTAYGPLGSSMALRRKISEMQPALIHQHGIWQDDQWAALGWQKRTGRPIVVSPHGMLDPWAVENSAWKKKLAGKLFADKSLQRATCIHALCRSEIKSIRAYGLKNPIALIPNGVELPSMTSDPCPPTSGVKRKLLFLGRIHPKKGLSELLKGWEKAKSLKSKAFSNWQLLIAGWDDGGHEAGLKALAEGQGETVEFIGPQFGEAKEQLLRSVDAFILPSFSEGLPMSVLEAWSYGLPAIMTDFCNLPEGFSAAAAIRIEPNPESIFHGLEQLAELSDAELLAMGAEGRQLVEDKFTWPTIAGNMRSVYEWCLHGGNPPDCVLFDDCTP